MPTKTTTGKRRKFVYVLGAGASFGAGASAAVQGGGRLPIPTQATFWETFLRFCAGKKNRKEIESFLFRYFLNYRRVPTRLRAAAKRKLLANVDVEEVFTFLSERARAPSTSVQLRTYSLRVWAALVAEIGNVFRHFEPNHSTRKVFRAFVKNHFRSRDVVVSFNYDTTFEASLQSKRKYSYSGVADTASTLPILKPHGSVNWELGSDGSVNVVENPRQSVIVAPTHLKFVALSDAADGGGTGYLDQAQPLRQVWTQMENQMKAARALVFIGYSFPIADLYFSSILRSVLADRETDPDVVVVNPDAVAIAQRLQERFAVRKVLRYFDFAQFVQISRKSVISQMEP